MLDVATRSALAALAAPTNGDCFWVREIKAVFAYDSASAATPNRWTVIKPGSAIATGTLTITSTNNAANGETVTIDSKVYTFQTVLTDVDGHVLIGANKAASLANLSAAINGGAGRVTNYASSTNLHPSVVANGASPLVVSAKNASTTGNAITTTDTLANGSWGGATLAGGADTVAGRYVLADTELTLPIIGGGADDWINYGAANAACAASGKWLQLGEGEYFHKSRQFTLSKSRVRLTSSTIVTSDIGGTGDNRDAPFCVYADTNYALDTLASDTEIGDDQITIFNHGGGYVVGDHIFISTTQYRIGHYEIVAWNPTTRVAKLDRPLRHPYGSPAAISSFPNGSPVWNMIPGRDVEIHFNGAHLRGACNRYIECWGGWECNFIGPVYCGDGTSVTAAHRIISLDTPCYNCHAYRIIGDGGDTTILGLSFESTENCTFQRCEMRRCENGAIFQDAIDSHHVDCICDHNFADGAVVTAAGFSGGDPGSGSLWGSDGCKIVRGSYSKNGQAGIHNQAGTSRCVIDGPSLIGNSIGVWDELGADNLVTGNTLIRKNFNGIYVDSGSSRLRVESCVVTDNVNNLNVVLGNVQTRVANTNLSAATGSCVLAAGNISLENCTATSREGNVTSIMTIGTDAVVRGRELNFTQLDAGGSGTVDCVGLLNLESGSIVQATNGVGLHAYGSARIMLGRGVSIGGHGAAGSAVVREGDAIVDIVAGAVIASHSVQDAVGGQTIGTLDTMITTIGFVRLAPA